MFEPAGELQVDDNSGYINDDNESEVATPKRHETSCSM